MPMPGGLKKRVLVQEPQTSVYSVVYILSVPLAGPLTLFFIGLQK